MHFGDERSTILTGATGFLGAFLMAGLLERGYHVTVLGRSGRGINLAERLSALMNWFNIDPGERLISIETDFSQKYMGLDDDTYDWLCKHAGRIIHCASDTSFSERNRARVFDTNVNILTNLLKFAEDSKDVELCYVSTAYAAGMQEGKCMESRVSNNRFNNLYEESKARAENIIIDFCEKSGIPFTILRPSIVFGHSKTGKALKFNALYYVVKSLLIIRDIFIKDITEHGGERSRKWGFSLEDNGILHMSMNVSLKNMGFVNLIPVDYFVDSALSIIGNSESNGIYHITNDNPPDLATLVKYTEQFLNIKGIRLVLNSEINYSELNPAEELFEKFIKQYRPYFSDTKVFDKQRTDKLTRVFNTPLFDYDIFQRCMNYAIENNWGKKNAI